jgi:sugar phosphate isomerase/epimerase
MISIAASTIALPPGNHDATLTSLAAVGVEALEVAPSRRWENTWEGLQASEVSAYRKAIEGAGLHIIGLHSLLFDHKELLLFGDTASQRKLADFLVHLSEICRDLGGRTLIWGGGRLRGTVPQEDALTFTIDFMGDICNRVAEHGTAFCFEPLGPNDSDFINSALDALQICHAIDHPALAMQLDAKALVENNEVIQEIFSAVASDLIHVHANEPGLAVVGSSGIVDHVKIGAMLHEINYDKYVSAEQRMMSEETWLDDLATSIKAIQNAYCHKSIG